MALVCRGGCEERNDRKRHEERERDRERAGTHREDGLALEAALTSRQRPQCSGDDCTGHHHAHPDDHQQRPCRYRRRGAAAAEGPPTRGAGHGQRRDYGGESENGAKHGTVKLDDCGLR